MDVLTFLLEGGVEDHHSKDSVKGWDMNPRTWYNITTM